MVDCYAVGKEAARRSRSLVREEWKYREEGGHDGHGQLSEAKKKKKGKEAEDGRSMVGL